MTRFKRLGPSGLGPGIGKHTLITPQRCRDVTSGVWTTLSACSGRYQVKSMPSASTGDQPDALWPEGCTAPSWRPKLQLPSIQCLINRYVCSLRVVRRYSFQYSSICMGVKLGL
jgi:hypothetical protein